MGNHEKGTSGTSFLKGIPFFGRGGNKAPKGLGGASKALKALQAFVLTPGGLSVILASDCDYSLKLPHWKFWAFKAILERKITRGAMAILEYFDAISRPEGRPGGPGDH